METFTDNTVHHGDTDVSHVAALFADQTRARVLVALADGRSLPAGVLASEAGVSAQAVSTQLSRLRRNGLIDVEQSGRHRYYRLASDHVATILEALAVIAPTEPVRSLRQGTEAAALRRARTCYDHLAGRLGCALTAALLDHGALVRTDERTTTERRPGERLSAPVTDPPYALGPAAADVVVSLGLAPEVLAAGERSRPLLRFCVDWSEQRHHVGGRLGAELLKQFLAAGWVARRPRHRAVDLTELGSERLRTLVGVDVA
jgi:DNA-binding transcriptional ArsR family regulator